MNMQSTTLISTNYALNFALWLYQALLNCEIHRLMKKLVTDTLHVAIFGALVTGQTASPYFFLPQQQQLLLLQQAEEERTPR